MKMALIDWVDSCDLSGDRWHIHADVEEVTPLECRSAGFVVSESKSHITIASTMNEGQYHGFICIPKCAITKHRQIK